MVCGNPDASLIIARVSPIYLVSSETSSHDAHSVAVTQHVWFSLSDPLDSDHEQTPAQRQNDTTDAWNRASRDFARHHAFYTVTRTTT